MCKSSPFVCILLSKRTCQTTARQLNCTPVPAQTHDLSYSLQVSTLDRSSRYFQVFCFTLRPNPEFKPTLFCPFLLKNVILKKNPAHTPLHHLYIYILTLVDGSPHGSTVHYGHGDVGPVQLVGLPQVSRYHRIRQQVAWNTCGSRFIPMWIIRIPA